MLVMLIAYSRSRNRQCASGQLSCFKKVLDQQWYVGRKRPGVHCLFSHSKTVLMNVVKL